MPEALSQLRSEAVGWRGQGGLRAVHTTADLADTSGGPSRSAARLCDALARHGIEIEIVTSPTDGPEVLPREETVRVHRAPAPSWTGAFGWPTAFGDAVSEAARGPRTVVHDSGLWLPSNGAAAHAARRAGAPLVVSLKGMASRWALRHHKAKKQAAWWVYQRRALALASVFQATSEEELRDAHRLGLGKPVALVPHGVEMPPDPTVPARRGGRRALFLSRIHPKKGIPMLLEAWRRVAPEGWELVLAGPDEGGHRAEMEALTSKLGLSESVRFAGPLPDHEKWSAYCAADLFILPTHSENFGIVVAEAMAAGVPVITTKGAPWEVLERERCGWWTDISVDAIEHAVREAVGLTESERRAAGQRGRDYVVEHLSWDRAAEAIASVYAWLLGAGPRPPCVHSPSES